MERSLEVEIGFYPDNDKLEVVFEEREEGWYINPPQELKAEDNREYAADGFSVEPYLGPSARWSHVHRKATEEYNKVV